MTTKKAPKEAAALADKSTPTPGGQMEKQAATTGVTETLLPPAEPDDEYDPYLLLESESETPQAEAELSAVLWPDAISTTDAGPSAVRRMTKEAFTKALLSSAMQKAPVYEFRTVPASAIPKLKADQRAIVDAPPGSGKTWALVRRIMRLAARETDPAGILVLCPTPDVKRELLARLRAAARRSKLGPAWKQVQVATFDAYAAELMRSWQEQDPERLREIPVRAREGNQQPLQDAAMLIRRHPELVMNLQHVLVDDIQNVVGMQAAFLLQLLASLPPGAGFTLFGDRCQALFDLPSAKSSYASADQLYGQLMRAYPDAELLTMEGNHRSSSDLRALSEPFRRAILAGAPQQVKKAADELLGKVRSQDIAWQTLHPTSLRSIVTGKTLGILTRTAGEALAISNLLHRAGITHNLLLDNHERQWAGWLGRVLLAHDGQTLDKVTFAEIFRDLYPGADPDPYWEALTATQEDPPQSRYVVRDLLVGVHRLRDSTDLGSSPDEEQAAVTVGTIRMARGREFDTVLLASDLFNGGGYTDRAQREAAQRSAAEVLAESRLAYVGLTRARKSLYLMMLPLDAVRLSKVRSRNHSSGRWYKSQVKRLPTTVLKSYRRRTLHAFEVDADDFVPESFAEDEEAQTYLLTAAPDLPDAEMELHLSRDAGTPVYELSDPEQPGIQLAVSDADFMSELTSALGFARKVKRDQLSPEDYPETFREVYVQRVVTHIGSAEQMPPHAKAYGDQAVWLGLEIVGFAKAINRT